MLLPNYIGKIEPDEGPMVVIGDSETNKSLFLMQAPHSFIAKNNFFKFQNFVIENKCTLIISCSAYGGHELKYLLDKDLFDKPAIWFTYNWEQLAGYLKEECSCSDIKSYDNTNWVYYVGYRDRIFEMYYTFAINRLMRKVWETKEPGIVSSFENTLESLNGDDRRVLLKLCMSSQKYSLEDLFLLIYNWYRKYDIIHGHFMALNYELALSKHSDLEKYFFFLRSLRLEKKNPDLKHLFHDGRIVYTDDNIKRIIELMKAHKSWSIVTEHQVIDDESIIMNALSSGEGDLFGF